MSDENAEAGAAACDLRELAKRSQTPDAYGLRYCADLIEWQQRRIHALTTALIEARVAVSDSRIVYAEIAREVGVSHAAETKALLSDYDELLARIDRALEGK